MKVVAKEREGATAQEGWRRGNSTVMKCVIKEVLPWDEKDAVLNVMREIGHWEEVGTKRVGNLQETRRPKQCGTCKLMGRETKTL